MAGILAAKVQLATPFLSSLEVFIVSTFLLRNRVAVR
jgi:hypothetical protein